MACPTSRGQQPYLVRTSGANRRLAESATTDDGIALDFLNRPDVTDEVVHRDTTASEQRPDRCHCLCRRDNR